MEHHPKSWYDSWYKILLLPPVVLFVLSLVYLGVFYSQHNDFVHKDASLSGGTTITLSGDINTVELESALKAQVPDVSFRSITDLTSGKPVATIIDSSAEPSVLMPIIEKSLGHPLTAQNSNIEFTGPTLSQNFYKQLIIAIIFSFVLMSIVIFILFRSFVPSIAVIFAALADILMSLAFIDYLGVRLSAAGIAAFLMLIGYSVDTDILLTTRVVKKREGTVNQRIYGAFTTGLFMTVTALIAVLPAFFIVTGLPESFRQIFLILAVGLFADIFNTWLTNASIIKWYADAKGMK
ncbi:protein translocase subunit SecF [Candidatus Pacearchaeota archaeon]|nr:protein translocase subunit SecF [Candidatus Pacearchaeota archaeon]